MLQPTSLPIQFTLIKQTAEYKAWILTASHGHCPLLIGNFNRFDRYYFDCVGHFVRYKVRQKLFSIFGKGSYPEIAIWLNSFPRAIEWFDKFRDNCLIPRIVLRVSRENLARSRQEREWWWSAIVYICVHVSMQYAYMYLCKALNLLKVLNLHCCYKKNCICSCSSLCSYINLIRHDSCHKEWSKSMENFLVDYSLFFKSSVLCSKSWSKYFINQVSYFSVRKW
jgi:hypothetical protein